MKVKYGPADFRVEELTDRTPAAAGGFALYRLAKTGWTTPDAVGAVCRRWKVDRRRVSFGGLKDRHAVTAQFLTVEAGPPRSFTQDHVTLTYLGQADSPFTSDDISANRFAITLRDLSQADAHRAFTSVPEVVSAGLPNYFDDQRFGSLGSQAEFVGRLLVKGEFEAALKLALTAPYEFDRAPAKRAKTALRTHWGHWAACREALPRGLGDFLVRNPTAFRGAIERLHPELQGMHLAAYQSDLWNRTLVRWLTDAKPSDSLGTIRTNRGELPVPLRPNDAFDSLLLPLPSGRMQAVPGAAWWPSLSAVLAEEGLTLDQLRVPGLRRPFFSKGERHACLRPVGLSVEPGDDETHPGRMKLLLRFDLPRGAYATMVVKRLTSLSPVSETVRR